MSQENVELTHRVYEALKRRDLDALLALYDADVEAEPTGGVVFGTSYHGHDGARRFWNELFGAFPDFSAEILEVRDLGNLVLGVVRFRGHGAGSDAPVEQTVWQVAEWRDGKLVWCRSCASEKTPLISPRFSSLFAAAYPGRPGVLATGLGTLPSYPSEGSLAQPGCRKGPAHCPQVGRPWAG